MKLPDIDFIKVDSKDIERSIFSSYETMTGRKLYPGNPERLFLEAIAYNIGLLKWDINYSAKQNLLAYAEGDKLDYLGELLGVERLQPVSASATFRFYLSETVSFDVVIPKGTQISGNNLIFSTSDELKIKAGDEYGDVVAYCTSKGTIGNGYLPGQINTLVNPIPYVKNAENITTTMGGADTEDDEHLRERIRLAPERFSNAGSKGAYIFHTKSAHQDIEDVSVYSLNPGEVDIVFLLKDGALPDSDMIQTVEDYLNDEKIRPLTDKVVVSSPDVVKYDISFTYYIHKDYSALVSDIESKVSEAVNDFIYYQKTKIGRDVLPEELIARLKTVEGVYRIELSSPAYIKIEQNQVAQADSISFNYGGVMDD